MEDSCTRVDSHLSALELLNRTAVNVQPLSELNPQFFIPRLEDKPQNPIMDTLRIMKHDHVPSSPPAVALLPPELQALSEETLKFAQVRREAISSLWELAASRDRGTSNRVLSWDALRPSFKTRAEPSPFLSEQSTAAFASARYHLRPPLQYPHVQLIYVKVADLIESLLLTVCGISSHLHIWDHTLQKFVLRNLEGRERGELIIVGKDEVVSASILERFLTIGNLIRRLEIMVDSSESLAPPSASPLMHAFNHALSSVLSFVRHEAETVPPDLEASSGGDARLIALWTQYEDIANVLLALAHLCGREEQLNPADYAPIPSSPTQLLSLIYQQLAEHLDRASSHAVTASIAFVLTTTSRGYFKILCASVGYNTLSSSNRSSGSRRYARAEQLQSGLLGDDAGRDEDHIPSEAEFEAVEYPEFVDPETAEILSRAHKSLVLLRAADPEHPLLASKTVHRDIDWLWMEEQLDNIEDGSLIGHAGPGLREVPVINSGEHPSNSSPFTLLESFKVFDLTPGELRPNTHQLPSSLLVGSRSATTLNEFLHDFPLVLPPSTPSLAHLTARVLAPLVAHAQALSGALVARFLAPTTHLHLHTHLVLLRGFLLLTSDPFKARLQDALFADGEDVDVAVAGSRTFAAREARENARERSRTKSGTNRSKSRNRTSSGTVVKARRAVGLSPALTIGDKWPPLGSDLNFLLRTVVVDALEKSRSFGGEDEESELDEIAQAHTGIINEAEWRLGFAIRDMPMGPGKEKWLNPLSIQALDFLYIHYQPPYPLDVLITPAVLSKYHRMFAFNLRLMRLENVTRILFRLTRTATTPLFPTLAAAQKLLLHFRFVVQSFVMGLSSYVYDIAIGSNIDAFLERLAAASSLCFSQSVSLASSVTSEAEGTLSKDRHTGIFTDVFVLADHHSRVLDDVLSACLLRSGQKAVSDILRACMELVLELGVLVGERRDGNLEEYEAAPALEDLWHRYRAKMTTFVKVLKALVEKEADSSGLVLSEIPLHMMQGHKKVSRTIANLHQLLLRLNMSDWWTRKDSKDAPEPAKQSGGRGMPG